VGLIAPILPELKMEPEEDWERTLGVLAQMPEQVDFPLALAAVLHRYVDAGEAAEIGERLKLSNAERDRICWLVEKHDCLDDAPNMRKSKLKQILNRPGIQDLLLLHRAIALASGASSAHIDYAKDRLQEWVATLELNPPALITGDDLKQLGIPPGPQYKQLLDAVREAQLDDAISTREDAIELAKRVHTQSLNP
jgi:poly(A) polymerase